MNYHVKWLFYESKGSKGSSVGCTAVKWLALSLHRFEPWLGLFYVEFACLPSVCMDFSGPSGVLP